MFGNAFGAMQNWFDPEGQDDREEKARRAAVIEAAKQDKALRRQQMAFGTPTASTYFADPSVAAANHFANLGNAISGVNSAISGEMQSRVAQEREARRMEHEKYLAHLALQGRQAEAQGNIIRSLLNG